MDLPTFISTYTGQAVDVDGVQADTGQCVQLVQLYAQKVLGVTLPNVTGAVDLWNNAAVQENFDQIPVGGEQAGDIAVWGASSLINSPEYGHTDIVITPGFTGFDSNWGNVNNAEGQPVAHEVAHTYQDVLGFLRYKGDEMSQATIDDIYNHMNQTNITVTQNSNDIAHLIDVVNELNINMGKLINPGERLDTDYANLTNKIDSVVKDNNLKG